MEKFISVAGSLMQTQCEQASKIPRGGGDSSCLISLKEAEWCGLGGPQFFKDKLFQLFIMKACIV